MTDNKTAIMFTDIIGYSSMMGRDESYALKLISEHNEIVEPTIKQYGGKIIKHMRLFNLITYFIK